jgi:porphobilinogen synthase
VTLFPDSRPRRLRTSAGMRLLAASTHLVPGQLMLPVFVRPGGGDPTPISSMPGVVQHTLDSLPAVIEEAVGEGLSSVMIFGLAETKDSMGSEACSPHSVLAIAVSVASRVADGRLAVVADLCLDEFTDHGHCGVLTSDGADVDNDATLAIYQQMAVVLATAGADVVGLSGMMDGQVGAVRHALDDAGFTSVATLAYAAKYASAFYGPFREAVNSDFRGTRRSYQMDYRNRSEALREVTADITEGADMVMVKPATAYLDIVSDVRARVAVPVAAYVVSGELAMVETAAAEGLIDREAVIDEMLVSVARAGANIICTYWALEWAKRFWQQGRRR